MLHPDFVHGRTPLFSNLHLDADPDTADSRATFLDSRADDPKKAEKREIQVPLSGISAEWILKQARKTNYFRIRAVGFYFALHVFIMLTRREILIQLRSLGVKEPSLLKEYLRDFERYMKENYGLEVIKKSGSKKKETAVEMRHPA
jgi:hypothetical protein